MNLDGAELVAVLNPDVAAAAFFAGFGPLVGR